LGWTRISSIHQSLEVIASEDGLKLYNPGQVVWSFKFEKLREGRDVG
jgi:hypothetical protein